MPTHPQTPAEPEDVAPPGVAAVHPDLRVALPAFEGPLDLLLHLIREHKLDVFDIPIALIAEKYNQSLAQMALDHLISAGTPCESELLYGLPSRRALRVARAQRVTPRLYVPYGQAWLPYHLSHARHNPGLLWWVTRDLVRGGAISTRLQPRTTTTFAR